jgi:hypothetical protein
MANFRKVEMKKLLLIGLLLLPSLSYAMYNIVIEILPKHSRSAAKKELRNHGWVIDGGIRKDNTVNIINTDPNYIVVINGKKQKIECILDIPPDAEYNSLIDYLTKKLNLRHSRFRYIELPFKKEQQLKEKEQYRKMVGGGPIIVGVKILPGHSIDLAKQELNAKGWEIRGVIQSHGIIVVVNKAFKVGQKTLNEVTNDPHLDQTKIDQLNNALDVELSLSHVDYHGFTVSPGGLLRGEFNQSQ